MIRMEYEVIAREFTIETYYRTVTCIVGKHGITGKCVRGTFLAIPMFGMAVELVCDGNIEENTKRILKALNNIRATSWVTSPSSAVQILAREIAEEINPYITTELTN